MSISIAVRRVYVVSLLLALALLPSSACDRGNRANELAAQLNSQVQTGDFERIYAELDEQAKRLTPKEEFLRDMDRMVAVMKEFDGSLSWKKSSVRLSNEFHGLYFVRREMERNGESLDIDITFSYDVGPLKYYDLCVRPSKSSTGGICATNALRKI